MESGPYSEILIIFPVQEQFLKNLHLNEIEPFLFARFLFAIKKLSSIFMQNDIPIPSFAAIIAINSSANC